MKKTSFNENWFCNGKPVTLPHDAMICEQRDPNAPCGSAGAFFPGGKYVYTKSFARPEGEHVLLQFEGVYRNAKVFINGQPAGGAAYGYIPFFIDCDDHLVDGENTVRVECEVIQPDSRWYTGAGIYRPVWLWQGPLDSIEPESVKISTVSIDPAVIRIQSAKAVQVDVNGFCGAGTDFELAIPGALLWNAEHPNLYTANVSHGTDSEEIRFGIRRIEWSNKGLLVNGEQTLLRGGCVHHDNGILGAAAYDAAEFRRVRLLKGAGYNAIRSSHNPCSRALLEACDELGMYLIDEGWDMWFHHKNKYDYASQWQESHLADLKAIVDRDYNHPSVIFYSIGNEVSEPAKYEGIMAAKEMVEYLHSLDHTRAVTGGFNLMIIASARKGKGVYDDEGGGRKNDSDEKMKGLNSTLFNFITNMVGTGMNKAANSKKANEATAPSLDLLDIAGYNYASGRYAKEGSLNPERIVFGSETFPQDIAKNWALVEAHPYLIGDFMWTAWDYLGEAGLGAWAYTPDGKGFNKPYPWLLADCGAFDILGNPGAPVGLARAAWKLDEKPWIGVQPVNHPGVKPAKAVWRGSNAVPSWSWNGCEGNKAIIEVYSSAPQVEAILNGVSLGKKNPKLCKAVYKTKYAPGTLEAVTFDASGNELGRTVLRSASGSDICIQPEKPAQKPGEIMFVPVTLADPEGNVESNADRRLSVSVEGGELLAFGSAAPRTEERFDSGEYTTYYGRALAVIRTGQSGNIKITVNDDGNISSIDL